MKKAVAVYLRVSTLRQDERAQEPDLKAWLRVHGRGRPVLWYRDRFTGATLNRPGMRRLLADIEAGKVGTLLVWRHDRLGRGAREMLSFLEDLDGRGVEFVSLREGVTANNAAGHIYRHILVGFAQYERELLSERIHAGIARAKAQGKRWGGRKPGHRTRLTPEKLKAVGALLKSGTAKAAIARQLGLGERSVYRAEKILTHEKKKNT